MNLKNLASQAFQMPPLVPTAAPAQAPVPTAAGGTAAAPAAGSGDASSIRATGSRSTLGLMTSARDQIVGDFRAMFGDVVRANARLESANQALGKALASGDQAGIRSAAQGVTSALGDLQKNLQRLPGEVAKMKTLPAGVKDVYAGHLEEIGRIAGNLGGIPGSSGQPAGGVQAGGEAAKPAGESQAAAKPESGAATPSAPAKPEGAEPSGKGAPEVGTDLKAQKRERRFQKLDKNGDGILSADEIGKRQKLLRRDLDGDGQVSREEFLKGPVKRGEARPEAAQPASAAGSPVPAAGAETPPKT
ncbi:MAG: EF-hand domain-containing protein [bacterium]|nr:EF-hand domain-containing protein [bacterium]